jgi:hypothetical protein
MESNFKEEISNTSSYKISALQRAMIKCLNQIENYRIKSYYNEKDTIILECLKESLRCEYLDMYEGLNLFTNAKNLSDEVLEDLGYLSDEINSEIEDKIISLYDEYITEYPYGPGYVYI